MNNSTTTKNPTAPVFYHFETSELKRIYFNNSKQKYAAIAVYLSTTFWFFNTISVCRNLNKREVDSFTFGMKELSVEDLERIASKGEEILDDLQKNSIFMDVNYKQHGKLSLQVFQPKTTLPIANEIDSLLAKHYGFTEEEFDFINYDIKYSMGDELDKDA